MRRAPVGLVSLFGLKMASWRLVLTVLALFAWGCGPELAIYSDSDSSHDLAADAVGIVGIPNLDDDNENDSGDWADGVVGDASDDFTTAQVAGENDFVSFTIRDLAFRGLKNGESIVLVLSGDTNAIRIWSGDRVVLGAVAGGFMEDRELSSTDEDQVFEVEFRDFLTSGELRLEHRDRDQEVIAATAVKLTASPLLLNHHLQPSEDVWVVDIDAGPGFNNQQMVGVYAEVLGDRFIPIDGPTYNYDQWIQDEIEFGWTVGGDAANQIVVDSIRDRPLDAYPEDELLAPDVVIGTWGEPELANSLDYFGNLEVSPPVTVDGVDYPLGRIYWGGAPSFHPHEELTDFLEGQRVQRPFQVDTTWLCVSHIDEFTSFVPDPDSEKGFKFIYSGTQVAWELLEQMDPGTALPRYGLNMPNGHGLPNVAALVNNGPLRDLNEEIQEDYLDPILDQFKEELGLTDDDIMLMPSLFEEAFNCGGYVAALIPGMANLISTTSNGQTDIFLADPFTRDSNSSESGQGDDPLIQHVREHFPDSLDLHFVDNWSVYHMQLGEVHCGTNVQRTPDPLWWQDSLHLLEGSP
ncbi:MAG: hypothetical protein CL928_10250 [Deltaproteobacteria bacterium]|nr:hypothetical protein [Deltaproteobacteria bacterium]